MYIGQKNSHLIKQAVEQLSDSSSLFLAHALCLLLSLKVEGNTTKRPAAHGKIEKQTGLKVTLGRLPWAADEMQERVGRELIIAFLRPETPHSPRPLPADTRKQCHYEYN